MPRERERVKETKIGRLHVHSDIISNTGRKLVYMHMYTCTHTYMYMHALMHTHTTHARTHACTHTHNIDTRVNVLARGLVNSAIYTCCTLWMGMEVIVVTS